MTMFPAKKFIVVTTLMAAGMTLLALQTALADDAPPSSAPATAPASAPSATAAVEADEGMSEETPASMPSSASGPTTIDTSPLPPAKSLREGLKFDAAEETILSAIYDRNRSISDGALYVLLRRALALPQLNERQYESELSQISYDSLMDRPKQYRGTPIRLTVRVSRVDKWTPGKQFRPHARWPKGKPIWWIGGLDLTGKQPSKKDIILLSVVDPTPWLGQPDQPDGSYSVGRFLDVAGLFYKVYDDMSKGTEKYPSQLRSYPVIVAWQVGRGEVPGEGSGNWMWWAGAITMAIMIGLFFYFRRNASRIRRDTGTVGFRNYHPLRDVSAEEGKGDQPPVDGEVDPALREAAERFKKEKK